ncbi:MAG: efflux transporter outer membrane subunit [Neisseriaceae bacterium]|nr:efflux transporter outer membrane subunit [Neisseriaceae bacterium]
MNQYPKILTLVCLLALSSCATVPNAVEDIQNIPTPEKWQNAQAEEEKVSLPYDWWKNFEDPELNRLMAISLNHNKDIQMAAYNLQAALLQLSSATADLFPSINSVGGNASSQKSLEGGSSSRHFGLGGGIGFQVDLFGKLINSRDVKSWLAQASAEDQENVRLAVTTKTADLYWQLAAKNQEIALTTQDVANAQKLFELMQVKYKVGAVAQMDLLTSEQNLHSQQNQLVSLQHQRRALHNALAIFIGESTEASFQEPTQLPEILPPDLPVNLPDTVLDHRPDIRAARMRLMADMENVNVALRDFFPSINVTGNVSTGGNSLSSIAKNPMGSVGLNLLLPIFNLPDNIIHFKTQKINYQSNLIAYRNTLFSALSEVENAHSEQQQLLEQNTLLTQNRDQAKKIERMRQVRYEQGADALQDYLNAQNSSRSAERSLLNNRLAIYQNFLTRYVALGGARMPQTAK